MIPPATTPEASDQQRALQDMREANTQYEAAKDQISIMAASYGLAMAARRYLRVRAESSASDTARIKELEGDIEARKAPRHRGEPQYDQSDADAFYLGQENRTLKTRIAALEQALRSIANNSCCTPCQEAALVARAALKGSNG